MSKAILINVDIRGKNYSSWKDVIEDYPDNNLDSSLLSQRYNKGKREEDLIKPKQFQNKKLDQRKIVMNIDGKNYGSLKELAEDYCLNYSTVKHRYLAGKRGKELIKKV